MKKVISLKNILRKKNCNFEEAIGRMLNKNIFYQLKAELDDKRLLVACAARLLNSSEETVIQTITSSTGYSYSQRVSEVDLDKLPADANLSLFRRYGAIPVCAHGFISGIVCSNPEMCSPLREAFPGLPVFVSSWSSILKALNNSELKFTEKRKKQKLVEVNKIRENSLKAIQLAVQETLNHGSRTCNISLEQKPFYQFTDLQGRKAQGFFHNSLKEPLEEILQNESKLLSLPDKEISIRYSTESRFYIIETTKTATSNSSLKSTSNNDNNSRKEVLPVSITGLQPASTDYIMILDDNSSFTMVLKRYLDKKEYNSTVFTNASVALEHLISYPELPKLIVCDLHMPEMNGYEFLMKIRNIPSFRNLPFIMLSSDDNVDTRCQVLTSGAEAYLCKSEDPRLLFAHISRLLDKISSDTASEEAA